MGACGDETLRASDSGPIARENPSPPAPRPRSGEGSYELCTMNYEPV
jgi:hypothetical protein